MTKAKAQPTAPFRAESPSSATVTAAPVHVSAARRGDALLSDVARNEPLLSLQEEQDLARRLRAGDESAARRLILSHLRFVIRIARRYRRTGLPLADLVQEGTVGLILAVRRFRPERG